MHIKKMIAPIIISILMVLYYILFFGLLIYLLDGLCAVIVGIIPLALGTIMIYVCVQRIKEIRSGEEDDLSKY